MMVVIEMLPLLAAAAADSIAAAVAVVVVVVVDIVDIAVVGGVWEECTQLVVARDVESRRERRQGSR